MRKFLRFLIIFILVAAVCWYCWDNYYHAKADPPGPEQVLGIDELPPYSGEPSVEINGGRPDFADHELKAEYFQEFSELDSLGRCGPATACVDRTHMPEGEREEIDTIYPSGWEVSTYNFIDNGGFLFNRCHMIGWQLTGTNAEKRNLITGTRYMNVEGMLPYENQVARCVRYEKCHVLYRVTPVFVGRELVCRGVQMEAESVEDKGECLSFNVYCYNVQPGVEIDYETGENRLAE